MKRIFWPRVFAAMMVLLAPVMTTLAAQEHEGLQLRLDRNFGYGGFGKIQGRFTLRIQDAPDGLAEVRFYLDGELVETDQEEPFEFKFHTSEFSEGMRVMQAIGLRDDGSSLESNRISKEFLSSEQAWSETEGILVPLLLGVGILTLLGAGLPVLTLNQKNFVPGKYGPAGGVVCPRCGLPFSRSVLSPNLLVGKLVRCPHCGKTSVLPRSSREALREAEERYQVKDGMTPVQSGGDLSTQIEESRYED